MSDIYNQMARDALAELSEIVSPINRMDALAAKFREIAGVKPEGKSNPALEAARHTFPHKVVLSDDPQPKPEWKPGQMLVNKFGKVFKLGESDNSGFAFQEWDGERWADGGYIGIFKTNIFVPYPRVGDWVKCTSGHAHSNKPFVFSFDTVCGACNLEPASPPVQHGPCAGDWVKFFGKNYRVSRLDGEYAKLDGIEGMVRIEGLEPASPPPVQPRCQHQMPPYIDGCCACGLTQAQIAQESQREQPKPGQRCEHKWVAEEGGVPRCAKCEVVMPEPFDPPFVRTNMNPVTGKFEADQEMEPVPWNPQLSWPKQKQSKPLTGPHWDDVVEVAAQRPVIPLARWGRVEQCLLDLREFVLKSLADKMGKSGE